MVGGKSGKFGHYRGLRIDFWPWGGGLVLTSIVEEGGYMAVFGWREKGRRDNLYRGVSI
jgi:hypothetical protein